LIENVDDQKVRTPPVLVSLMQNILETWNSTWT